MGSRQKEEGVGMIKGMTGFGSAELTQGSVKAVVETAKDCARSTDSLSGHQFLPADRVCRH